MFFQKKLLTKKRVFRKIIFSDKKLFDKKYVFLVKLVL